VSRLIPATRRTCANIPFLAR